MGYYKGYIVSVQANLPSGNFSLKIEKKNLQTQQTPYPSAHDPLAEPPIGAVVNIITGRYTIRLDVSLFTMLSTGEDSVHFKSFT